MNTGIKNTPNFRGAMFGYHKADVNSYAERVESELEIQQNRYTKLEQQLGQLAQETDRAKNTADEKMREARLLTEQNAELRRTIRELEGQIAEKDQLSSRIQEENRKLQQQLRESGADPKTIQDAIVNAQRMSGIILEEAREESQAIRHQAEQDRQQAEDASRQTLAQARQEAEDMIQSAQRRCDSLQRDYDQVLMDVTLFKANLLQMYREHMEKLLALPEKEPLQLECVTELEVVEEKPT